MWLRPSALRLILPESCLDGPNVETDIMEINNGEIGPLSQKLYDTLTGIQWGKIKDEFGWTVEVK